MHLMISTVLHNGQHPRTSLPSLPSSAPKLTEDDLKEGNPET